MLNKLLYKILCACVLITFAACKTTKQVSKQPILPIESPINNILAEQARIKTINASRVNFSIPMQQQPTSLRGSIKATIDSCLQISIQALFGIEVARIHITQDSLILLDRMNQQYVAESFSSFNTQLPVTYDMLQAIILNRIADASPSNDFSFFLHQKEDNLHILSYENSNFAQQYIVNSAHRLQRASISDQTKTNYIMAEYQQFETLDAIVYPKKSTIFMLFSNQQYTVEYSIDNVEYNKKIDLNVSIPPRYKRILLADIAKEIFK
jgi:hypothetical protein